MKKKNIRSEMEKLVRTYGFEKVAEFCKDIDWNTTPIDSGIAARCPPGYRWSVEFGRCLADPLD